MEIASSENANTETTMVENTTSVMSVLASFDVSNVSSIASEVNNIDEVIRIVIYFLR